MHFESNRGQRMGMVQVGRPRSRGRRDEEYISNESTADLGADMLGLRDLGWYYFILFE